MELKRSGTQPSGKGPEEYFTGSVWVDPLFNCTRPGACARGYCYVQAWRPDSLAYAPVRAHIFA